MEKKEKSAKFLNQRKFYLVVPAVIFPFLTLFFWSMGGGQHTEAKDLSTSENGLNTRIPDAYIKKNEKPDKMTFYTMAKRDSDLRKGRIASDPYANKPVENADLSSPDGTDQLGQSVNTFNHKSLQTSLQHGSSAQDRNEQKVYQKLNQLNYALNIKSPQLPVKEDIFKPSSSIGVNSADIDRLEKMLKTVGQKDGQDPELQQINSMLEKIIDVQHPDRVQEKLKETSEKKRGQVFPVSVSNNQDQVNLFAGDNTVSSGSIQNPISSTGFYSLDAPAAVHIQENAITAVVHDEQMLVSGSTVKLRLTTDIYINGVLVPKDNFLFGIANLSGDRLNINVSSIQYQNSLYPVSLSIFDLDGLPGIYIPDAISRSVAKQSADQALNGLGMTALDPSLGVQAASAGIEAARSIVSKKIRLVKVSLKSGYQVLLRDSQSK